LCEQLNATSGLFSRRKIEAPQFLTDDAASAWFKSAAVAFAGVQQARAVWRINASGRVRTTHQFKTNAGAGNLLRREAAKAWLSRPRSLAMPDCIPTLRAGRESLFFLPIGVLRARGRRFDLVSYKDVAVSYGSTRFIEDRRPPADAQQVDVTWQYVNVKGGPDRRYKNNRRLPVMRYGELDVSAASGLQWHLQTSVNDPLQQFTDFLQPRRSRRRVARV
jgi:hypothetical protein